MNLKTYKINTNDPRVIEIIERIVKQTKVVPYGYQTSDDIKQDIWIICLNALKEWQPDKITADTDSLAQAIEKFLRVTVNNRLVNRFKEVTKTVRSPCPRCQYYKDDEPDFCLKYKFEKEKCSKFNKYLKSISRRNDLLNILEEPEERNNDLEWDNEMTARNIQQKIKESLPPELLEDFENMLNGVSISKNSIKLIREISFKVIEENKDVK